MSDTNTDFDPLEQSWPAPTEKDYVKASEDAARIQAKAEAFRDLADRFYMLWWNLPRMKLRQVDRDVVDMFRMFMDLAPSLGVSRNGIQELRECCGRSRGGFLGEGGLDPKESISGAQGVVSPFYDAGQGREPKLGWCPGDIVRRITKLFGVQYCEKCDVRRRKINAFFRCGSGISQK